MMMQSARPRAPEERRNQKKATVLPGINKLVRRQHQRAHAWPCILRAEKTEKP